MATNSLAHEHDSIHPAPTNFIQKYIFSTDHKVIAKQFIWLGLFFLGLGGIMAMMIRWSLAYPGTPFPLIGPLLFPDTAGVIDPDRYVMLFTMHGTIMIFFAITPILIGGFGNFCIPLMIGARDMAFPILNMLSFWAMFVSSVILLGSFFVPMGAAGAGWTSYPTLSSKVGMPGLGQTLWIVSIFIAGSSTIMGAINYITTIIRLRAPGMTYDKLPLTIWGFWMTAILNALFVPVIAAGMILLFLDRTFGTHFFMAGAAVTKPGGDPILYQHLFWIFGHPEVYILIFPAWGIISDLLSFFSRKPAYAYRATTLCMVAITCLSAVVYGHHMFTTGMSPMLGESFMLLTMMISIPAAVFFLNWLHTIWRGKLYLNSTMLFSLGFVFVFGLGGLTGLYLASISLDRYLHDTFFVVGHFHLTMAAAVLFGSFAALYFWFPKLFGRMMNETLGKLHFWLSFVPLVIVFLLMLYLGHAGMPRRIYDPSIYDYLKHLAPLNTLVTHVAFLLGGAQFLFLINFFYSLVRGKKATANPWNVGTLEWTISSPPPYYNYKKIPHVYSGPHEFSHPAVKGKDWLAQTEPVPNE